MNTTLSFFVFFITLINFGHSGMFGPFGGNIAQANLIRQKLIVAQIQIKACVRVSNSTIQLNIASAQNVIDQQVKNSQAKVKGGKVQCVNAHTSSLSELNSEYLKSCDQSVELNAASSSLNLIHSQLWICRLSADPLCFDNLDKQITDKVEESKEICSNAPLVAAECIDAKEQDAEKMIENADEAFSSCNV